MKFRFVLVCVLALSSSFIMLNGQSADEVLFSVGDMDVSVSEFKYIYEKNNGDNAIYTRDSIKEYLDLYKKFKMKVHAAKDMQLDTIKSLQKELAGYEKQLSNSYLIDKELLDKIARKEFQRMQEDRKFSHIFINISGRDTSSAYGKAETALKELNNGKSFEEVVAKYSEDKNTVKKDGLIGYMTAPFSDGFYEMENAVYNLEEGQYSDIVRSKAGYHIVKLHDIRPAKGTMEAAQIFVAKPDSKTPAKINAAKNKIKKAYQALENGEDFSQVVSEYSEDNKHRGRGGYIGKFSVNTYSETFEDAAFSLEKDGQYSDIVETDVGFHIIKRINRTKPTDQTYNEVKPRLIENIKQTERYQVAKNSLIKNIFDEGNVSVNEKNLNSYISSLDSNFLKYSWNPEKSDKVLISYDGEMKFTVNDFNQFLKKNSRERMRLNKKMNNDEAAQQLFHKFKRESAITYEESKLGEKYPDFLHLMREYKEGILLFEITKRKVWDKAAEDTSGLKAYFEKNRDKYQWKKRAVIHEFTFAEAKGSDVKSLIEKAQSTATEDLIKQFGTDKLSYRKYKIEKGNSRDNFTWQEGNIFDIKKGKNSGVTNFKKVVEILPAKPKTLDESRGYVISDYQEILEEKWVKNLKERYPYNLNKQTLIKLTK